jgi:membrane dipeptidase
VLVQNDRFILARTVEDILRANRDRKLAFDIEGMKALNGDINMVGLYCALGVRQMFFACILNNDVAGGCRDTDIGPTDFGRAIVREMNRVGIIVDSSHSSSQTSMDIIAGLTMTVMFLHSNSIVICNHQRDLSDEQIKTRAEIGGVVGINGMEIFLGDNGISNKLGNPSSKVRRPDR